MSLKQIKDDLLDQLTAQGKYQSYYIDLVNEYMEHLKVIKALKKDIKDRGILVEVTSGNGFTTKKHNESIQLREKELKAAMDILKLLELHKPIVADTSDEDYM